MSAPRHHIVKLSNPGDVLASVPHLVGFTPTNSLIVITVCDVQNTPRFGVTLRVDLPQPEEHYALADYLLNGPLRTQEADAVFLVAVGRAAIVADIRPPPDESATDQDPVPHQKLIDALREVLGGAGVAVLHALWTPEIRAHGPWLCYDDDGCDGEIADPRASPLAAAMTAAGVVTFESREELQALVAADPEDVLARRSARLDVLAEDTEEERGSADGVKRDLSTVFTAIHRTSEGNALTEDDYLRVLLALSDHRVRDLALSAALTEWAVGAEQLWLTLVRKAPPPELAEVASLLAVSAHLRGEGALASVALERVEAICPDHRLAGLLRRALDFGISPSDLTTVIRDAAEDARILIEEDGDRS